MKNPIITKTGEFYDHSAEDDGTDHAEDFTLRDMFAGFALDGLLSYGSPWDHLETSTEAYTYADAMLKARQHDVTGTRATTPKQAQAKQEEARRKTQENFN